MANYVPSDNFNVILLFAVKLESLLKVMDDASKVQTHKQKNKEYAILCAFTQ